MSLDIDEILSRVESHAETTGYFDRVNTHEPKNAPGNGLTCAIWCNEISPVLNSGLSTCSVRLEFNIRLFTSMLQEPQDAIDPNLLKAVDALLTNYAGDFELGGEARQIDLLGVDGAPVSARAGYIEQDKKIYRVFTINLPIVVNDVWSQSA